MIGAVLAGLFAVAMAGLWWIRRQLLVVSVVGRSMKPSLLDGDRVLVRRRSGGRVAVGEVVVVGPAHHRRLAAGIEASRAAAGRIVKRVVAVAGDPVPPGVRHGGRRVPPGMLAVLGDNPAESADSRHFGLVPHERVVGVVVRRLSGPTALDRPGPAGHPVPPG